MTQCRTALQGVSAEIVQTRTTGAGTAQGHAMRVRAIPDRRQEKSHPADRMASVLVGCQGFEP
ncbi:hypothetical protein, partial [Stenotrophomonas sp. SrG]|uniref:hypothetical protein n=1 Tax=Stenotrophomonas sp. SrG TaxID=3414430 RepID=UPI003CF3EA45